MHKSTMVRTRVYAVGVLLMAGGLTACHTGNLTGLCGNGKGNSGGVLKLPTWGLCIQFS